MTIFVNKHQWLLHIIEGFFLLTTNYRSVVIVLNLFGFYGSPLYYNSNRSTSIFHKSAFKILSHLLHLPHVSPLGRIPTTYIRIRHHESESEEKRLQNR